MRQTDDAGVRSEWKRYYPGKEVRMLLHTNPKREF